VSSTTADRSTMPAADVGVTPRDRVSLPGGLFLVAAAFVVLGMALRLMHHADAAITARRVLNQSSLVPPAVAFGVVGRYPQVRSAPGNGAIIAGAVSVERADEGGTP